MCRKGLFLLVLFYLFIFPFYIVAARVSSLLRQDWSSVTLNISSTALIGVALVWISILLTIDVASFFPYALPLFTFAVALEKEEVVFPQEYKKEKKKDGKAKDNDAIEPATQAQYKEGLKGFFFFSLFSFFFSFFKFLTN